MLETQETLKFLATFSIIVIFIYVIYYYINKYGLKISSNRDKNIKIIESHYFSRNKGLVLVKIKKSFFFLSIDENGIKKLKEWEEVDIDDNKVMSDEFNRIANEKKEL
ncbi:flagellar biosynthetic protein FliO [Nitrosophilus labii]|uniref:flagellar biosynthetic protein FliO n=1 Tax=Nitrosophilus labii TaxID=2706014 RepID=UPI001656D5E0|nr:flagellar biosynthetic protein FliO [Nitrosophilus labii]